jgi:hypothetical protein
MAGGPLKSASGLRSLDSLRISARGLFLACPEQLSKAKLTNGPPNRLSMSGDVHAPAHPCDPSKGIPPLLLKPVNSLVVHNRA